MGEQVEGGRPVNEALEHIEEAERDRAHARELRAEAEAFDAKADAEMLEAECDLEQSRGHDDDDDGRVKVHFVHLRDLDAVDFRVDDDMTLGAIWQKAYLKLEVERDDRDVLQAPAKHEGGQVTSLMPHLGLTLKDARHAKLCERDFEIAGRTGGA